MELRDAVPKDLFVPLFKNVKENVLATDWQQLQKNRPTDIGGICLFIWDEMVHREEAKEPFKIAPIVNNGFKGIAQFVEHELGASPVKDAYAVSYYNEIESDESFVDVSLAHCWPNDIHIADVEFSDNRKPVGQVRYHKGAERRYHGLHVFGEFLARLDRVAKDKGADRISLLVAHPDLHAVFTRHGFEVSPTDMAQRAFSMVGQGYAMIRRVRY